MQDRDLTIAIGTEMARASLLLDGEQYEEWLQLWTLPKIYEIMGYTPELRRNEVLLSLEGEELDTLILGASGQVRDGSSMRRITGAPFITFEQDTHVANASQSFAIFTTNRRGASDVYVLGTYNDVWHSGSDTTPKLTKRTVHLDTRDLSIGTHVVL